MFDKLEKMVERVQEIQQLMSDPAVMTDQKRFRDLGRELRSLEPIVEAYQKYKKASNDFKGSRELLESVSDPDLKALAQEEYDTLKVQIVHLEENLKGLLVPEDPNDSKNFIMEIRG